MHTSILSQELDLLNAQIGQVRGKLAGLEGELRAVESELETFSVERTRFEALGSVCNSLDRLAEIGAGDLFWSGVPELRDPSEYLALLRERIGEFESEILGTVERRGALRKQIDVLLDDLDDLHEEVRQAYAREERRQEEFVVEREISPLPYRAMIMPWSGDRASEGRFRRTVALALLLCIVFGSLIPMITLPVRDRSQVVEIPERLAMLVKKEPPKPEPAPQPQRPEQEPKPEPDPQKPQERPQQEKPQPTPAERQTARKKAESTGVLAFKDTFADLLEDLPVAKLGAQASLSNDASSGQATAQRSLVTTQARGSSGGISTAAVSRNVGSGNAGRIGGVDFARVESSVAGIGPEARPLSDGPGPARTDEEIQIVFDRYKATLYRIYNTELRKNPTLRGKMLLRITIEPGGEVSACTVESTDLASAELVAQIVERVQRFNFGPKGDVPRVTILYPIDFLPAG